MSGSGYTEYAYFDQSAGCAHSYLLPALRQALGKPRGPVLDLGCGNGWLVHQLLLDGVDAYGVDASESGIRLANARAARRFATMDLSTRALPEAFADKRFTTVISTEVIEHLYDPRAMLKLAREILKAGGEGGQLIVSAPYHGYLKNLMLALTGKLDHHFTVLWDGGHIKFFSRETLTQMLAEEGFRTVAFRGCGRFPRLWKSMMLTAHLD